MSVYADPTSGRSGQQIPRDFDEGMQGLAWINQAAVKQFFEENPEINQFGTFEVFDMRTPRVPNRFISLDLDALKGIIVPASDPIVVLGANFSRRDYIDPPQEPADPVFNQAF